MKLSIIVPCYNEADNLPRLLTAFQQTIGGRTDYELVLVNNGSRDRSAEVFRELLPRFPFARVTNVEVNQGYGFGILSGLRSAKGEYLAWTHADLQTDPADVVLGYDLLRKQACPERAFVRGVRRGRPLVDRVFTAGMSVVASAALGRRLYDINAQPKIFHRALLPHLDRAPWDFSLDLFVLHLAGRLGLDVLELPVDFGRRTHGEAKGGGSLRGKYKLTMRTLTYIFALRKKLREEAAAIVSSTAPVESRRAA